MVSLILLIPGRLLMKRQQFLLPGGTIPSTVIKLGVSVDHGSSKKKTKKKRKVIVTPTVRSPRYLAYSQLLPRNKDLAGSGESSGHPSRRAAGTITGIDALQADLKSHIPLQNFAQDFRDRVNVPLNLYEIQKSGAATARLSRRGTTSWRIRVSGDPFARAIVTRALEEMLPNTWGWMQLSRVEYDEVELDFEFITRSLHSLNQEQQNLSIRNNRAALTVYHYENSVAWGLASKLLVVEQTFKGLNILGLDNFVKSKPDPAMAADIVRLKASPAFMSSTYINAINSSETQRR